MFSDLVTIGKQYETSRKTVRKQIDKLTDRLHRTKDKEEIEIIEYDLSILRAMERDLKGIGKEALNYYNEGWWRSEDYTFNSRKSRNFYY